MINLQLTNDFLTEEEIEKLKILFKTDDIEEFNLALKNVAFAALTEYKEMLLGKGLPTRADEIKQHRLLHLIKHYFQGKIPTEAEVSSMFQLTETESRALIRNVRTRFRYQLESEILNTLQQTIVSAEFNNDTYHVVIQSDNVLEELNRLVSTNAPLLDPISKVRGSARKYQISEDTYELLSNSLGVNQEVAVTVQEDE
ncbi:hypothetical protein [Sutcliffiella cohnii]|uniref:hypothetical protein n=1 Tax=Sutcliffiella cohnii TaxID=33932 RepID=UPI002E24A57F|nr:hypothetical protein [Sutcliffiella cohnii]